MNKNLDARNYVRAAMALTNRHTLDRLEFLLAPDIDQPLQYPPIFVVGAPRSGSTLMTQVITDAFDLGYISNRHCQWYGAPALAERLFHPLRNKPSSDYRSQHGTTMGNHAPSECGQWWYRFFRRRPPYVTLDEVDPCRMRCFRQSVAGLTNAFDRPVLFKNLYASLRIQAIARYLPESLFIVAHRDEVDNGHSLLEARYKRFNDYRTWFSVEPPDTDHLRALPAHKQVIEQIRYIHATIDRDLEYGGISESRRFYLCYEEFCRDTHAILDKLEHFLRSNQGMVSRTGRVPRSFEIRQEIRIDESLYSAMVSYARRL